MTNKERAELIQNAIRGYKAAKEAAQIEKMFPQLVFDWA